MYLRVSSILGLFLGRLCKDDSVPTVARNCTAVSSSLINDLYCRDYCGIEVRQQNMGVITMKKGSEVTILTEVSASYHFKVVVKVVNTTNYTLEPQQSTKVFTATDSNASTME